MKAALFAAFVAAILIGNILSAVYRGIAQDSPEWTDEVFRPCCRNCVYWMAYEYGGEKGHCDKVDDSVRWDYCCLAYDGVDTELRRYSEECEDYAADEPGEESEAP